MNARELAAAIRKGHTMIRESTSAFLLDGCGCALGAAWVGSGRTEDDRARLSAYGERGIAKNLGISEQLAREISLKHCSQIPRLAIADWLETLDVSKPKDAQSFNDFMKVVTQPVELEAA